jgi:hypothetical protein
LTDHPEFEGARFYDDREENLIAAERYFIPYHFDLSIHSPRMFKENL